MKVVGYVRVSTEDQVESGHSLEAQKKAIRDWAKSHGHEMPVIYSDAGVSGKKIRNRPGLKDALDHACKSKGVFVVYSLSRATRSLSDSLNIIDRLEKCKANFASVTESLDTTTASGKAFFSICAVFAQLESDIVSERTKAVQGMRRKQGKRISGHLPYGYRLARDKESLLPIPEQQETIARMKALRDEGQSFQTIGRVLDKEGRKPQRAKMGRWTPSSVHGILLREAKMSEEGAA